MDMKIEMCILKSLAAITRGFNNPFNYRPQRSSGKVIFSQASVILSTGECLADTPGTHPRADTLLGRHPPGRQLLQRTVRILLECILVINVLSTEFSEFYENI